MLTEILAAILSPLSIELLLASIIGGFIFGILYNGRLRLEHSIIYHQLITAWGFLFLVFIFRIANQMLQGVAVSNPGGWIGIALLWGVFCLFIFIGKISYDHFVDWILKRKYKIKK